MKVVFLQDVPNVAKAGEIKEVAAGYGRNFLIPRKLAVLASPQAMSQVETSDKVQAKTAKEMTEIASQLDGKEVELKAHAGAKERLYGSITSADIAAELERTTGIAVDKRKIELEEPIRHLGSYEVTIRLGQDILPKITVAVTEEEAPAKEEEKPKKAKKATKKAETPEAKEKAPKKEKKTVKKAPKAAKKEAKPKAEKETKAEKAKTTKKATKATTEKKAAEKKAAPKKKAATKTTKAKTTKKKEETA